MKKNCWLCGEIKLTCVKAADVPSTVDATAFRVTDANYGQCAAVYQCTACGFRQCSDFSDVLSFYQAMNDLGYEASRAPRTFQPNVSSSRSVAIVLAAVCWILVPAAGFGRSRDTLGISRRRDRAQ